MFNMFGSCMGCMERTWYSTEGTTCWTEELEYITVEPQLSEPGMVHKSEKPETVYKSLP